MWTSLPLEGLQTTLGLWSHSSPAPVPPLLLSCLLCPRPGSSLASFPWRGNPLSPGERWRDEKPALSVKKGLGIHPACAPAPPGFPGASPCSFWVAPLKAPGCRCPVLCQVTSWPFAQADPANKERSQRLQPERVFHRNTGALPGTWLPHSCPQLGGGDDGGALIWGQPVGSEPDSAFACAMSPNCVSVFLPQPVYSCQRGKSGGLHPTPSGQCWKSFVACAGVGKGGWVVSLVWAQGLMLWRLRRRI